MQNLDLTNLVLAVLILYRVIRQQLAPRVVRFKPTAFFIIILLGIGSLGDAVTAHQVSLKTPQSLGFGVAALIGAGGFAALRAWSYRFWVADNGRVMRQGSWLTLIWWVVGIGSHLLIDRLWTGGAATLLLYLGITLLVQRGLVWWRGAQAFPQEIQVNAADQRQHRKHPRH